MRTHRITMRTHRSPSTPPVVDTTPTPETALESHTSIPTWPTDIHKYDASKVGVNLSQGLLLCNKDDTNFSMAPKPLINPFTEAKTSLPSPRGTLRVLLEVTETATNGGLSSTSASSKFARTSREDDLGDMDVKATSDGTSDGQSDSALARLSADYASTASSPTSEPEQGITNSDAEATVPSPS